jgi:hypothetical protein
LVIDSDQREGIDVFGCQEMHLLDPCPIFADEIQVRARIRRTLDPCRMDVRMDRPQGQCVSKRGMSFTYRQEGDKKCCVMDIRYIKYRAVASFAASASARTQKWAEYIAQPTFQTLMTSPLSFDLIIEQSNQAAMKDMHEFVEAVGPTGKPGFLSDYGCSPRKAETNDAGSSRSAEWCGLQPMPHQREAVGVFLNTLRENGTDMLLAHGAGTGKTLTSMQCIREWQKRHNNGKVLLVTPTQSGLRERWRGWRLMTASQPDGPPPMYIPKRRVST